MQQPAKPVTPFTNPRTEAPYTVNGAGHVFDRAVARAGLANPSEITLHTLRHTALSRMIATGYDDHTVKAISGHSSTRMLERYTHPTEERKIGALDLPAMGTIRAQPDHRPKSRNYCVKLVDGRRLELPTSALRTRRSPS